MKNIFKKLIVAVIIALMSLPAFKVSVYAQVNTDALKNGTFLNLSQQDKQDTINTVIQHAINDLGVTRPINVAFYNNANDVAQAYNTSIAKKDSDTIGVNMYYFSNTSYAYGMSKTVEYFLVETLAHEARHSYQVQHMNDGTEYAKNVTDSFNNYVNIMQSVDGYKANFVEADARDYGAKFANAYLTGAATKTLKIGSVEKTNIIAKNGKIFDASYYFKTYPDLASVGTDTQALLNHYNTIGIKEGRRPSAGTNPGQIIAIANDGKTFDAVYYATHNQDVVAIIGTDPSLLLKHYNEYGCKEGRKPSTNG